MYNFSHFVLGVAPTRRDGFPSPEVARKNKKLIMARLNEIFAKIPDLEIVNIDDVTEEGLIAAVSDVAPAAELFKQKKIDALFIPHANFGLEEGIAKLAYEMKVPVLLWGPRDGDPKLMEDNFRSTDTQCGLFATGRALLRYGIKFTYIENCWLDSPMLDAEIDRFIRTASVVKMFKKLRILQLSTRPRQFLSVKVNEGELMERFGIELTTVTAAEFESTAKSILEKKPPELAALIAEWDSKLIFTGTGSSPEEKAQLAAMELSILTLADKYDCITASSECWSLYSTAFQGLRGCFLFGDLSSKGFSVACECDTHGAISAACLQAVTRMQTPTFLADLTVRHPTNDNAELLWHCGPFPHTLAKAGIDKPEVKNASGAFEIKGGEMTLARFDADHGNYMLFADNCRGVDGPPTSGNFVWVETDNWPAWERRLVRGPYIHHIVGVHGDYKAALREACYYLDIEHDYGTNPNFNFGARR